MEYHIIDYWLGKGVCSLLLRLTRAHQSQFRIIVLPKTSSNKLLSSVGVFGQKNLYHKHIYTFWMRVIDVCKKTFKVRIEVYKNHSWLLALDLQSMTSGKKSFQSQNKF